MQFIYEEHPTIWILASCQKRTAFAVVGTASELFGERIGGKLLRAFHWNVPLPGGDTHSLWHESYGEADTIVEAKKAAKQFLDKLNDIAI